MTTNYELVVRAFNVSKRSWRERTLSSRPSNRASNSSNASFNSPRNHTTFNSPRNRLLLYPVRYSWARAALVLLYRGGGECEGMMDVCLLKVEKLNSIVA